MAVFVVVTETRRLAVVPLSLSVMTNPVVPRAIPRIVICPFAATCPVAISAPPPLIVYHLPDHPVAYATTFAIPSGKTLTDPGLTVTLVVGYRTLTDKYAVRELFLVSTILNDAVPPALPRTDIFFPSIWAVAILFSVSQSILYIPDHPVAVAILRLTTRGSASTVTGFGDILIDCGVGLTTVISNNHTCFLV